MKILALDLGDKWVGLALSDEIGITAKPFATIALGEIHIFLSKTLADEPIDTVVVGHPVTVSGRISDQTKVIEEVFEGLSKKFSSIGDRHVKWLLWDERFSSKRAQEVMAGRFKHQEKEKKSREHAVAAAFVLQSYLDYKAMQE
jgi:putative holliday junction resolvase